MKYPSTALLLAFLMPSIANTQTVYNIFSENMGNISVGSSQLSARTYEGFQQYGIGSIEYTAPTGSTTTIRDNGSSSSTSDYTAATGGNYAFINSASFLTISGINIGGASGMKLYFGISKTTTSDDGSGLDVEITVDGNMVTASPSLPTGTGTTKWYYVEPTITIPTGSTMVLNFANNSSTTYRIDDILLTSVTPLPVSFGPVKAVRKANNVIVSWTTLQETNNDYFEVQASADGKNFKTIKTLKSLSGNSDTERQYEVSLGVDDVAGILAVSFSFIILGVGFKRKVCHVILFAAFTILIIQFIACNKSPEFVVKNNYVKMFIRIKQVDKDKAIKYSDIVKVINE